MHTRQVEIAIVGAGSAGISALKIVRQQTDRYLLIDQGELGTTCARAGCMPSKALVEIARQYHDAASLQRRALLGDRMPPIDGAAVMAEVRRLRDHFSEPLRQRTRELSGGHFLRGAARLLDAQTVEVDGERIRCGAIILAVGSRPNWPAPWRAYANQLLDSERFFDCATLPGELALVGLGSIGLELGQACALLGSRVVGVDLQQRLGCLSDPVAIRHARQALERSMALHLGHAVQLASSGAGLTLCFADQCLRPEQLLLATGRCANLDRLQLDPLLRSDRVDPGTLQLGELPIFIAGDSSGGQALLHEAVDEGQIAARNALAYPQTRRYQRRVPLRITFTQPQLARVGCGYDELDIHSALIAEVTLANQGRLLLAGGGDGVLRLYADRRGKLLGAELVAPQAEHLAQLIAAWLAADWGVADALRQPFYHPTLEEGLRTALAQLARKIGADDGRGPPLERLRCP